MNKYLVIVMASFIVGIVVAYGALFYLRAESIKGKECNPNYSGCVTDYSCSGVGESVNVVGEDVYGLDRDGDGTGCDWSGGTWESGAIFKSFFFGGIGGAIAGWYGVRNRYTKAIESEKEAVLLSQQKERRARAQTEGMICPKCNEIVVKKSGKYGKFIGCSTYPTCTYTRKS